MQLLRSNDFLRLTFNLHFAGFSLTGRLLISIIWAFNEITITSNCHRNIHGLCQNCQYFFSKSHQIFLFRWMNIKIRIRLKINTISINRYVAFSRFKNKLDCKNIGQTLWLLRSCYLFFIYGHIKLMGFSNRRKGNILLFKKLYIITWFGSCYA
jgi:hypothetical protein